MWAEAYEKQAVEATPKHSKNASARQDLPLEGPSWALANGRRAYLNTSDSAQK